MPDTVMPKRPLRAGLPAKGGDPSGLPVAPEPKAVDAATGLAQAQALACRFLPECVLLWAGVAFDPASPAKLHTRLVAAVNLKTVALVGLEARPDAGGRGSEADGEDEDGPDAA
jgi:hypothetical protein